GERNEPAYVMYVADQAAKVKEVSFDELAAASTENARRLFGLPEAG
ncbi:MAG: TatD family hydrolase, partial [Armatimonadota bacterium]